MTDIDYKIIGIDETRPPKLQRQPCIDLFFELNETAPEGWCREFQVVVGKTRYPIKINPEEGRFIETWVRTPEEIAGYFETVKGFVAKCNETYRIKLAKERNQPVQGQPAVVISPAQQHLNEVVAKLRFD